MSAGQNGHSGFAVVPVEVLSLGNGYAIAVYAALARRANPDGECWPSMETLSAETGWHRVTVRKALGVLEKAGVVTIEPRKLNGMDQSNKYRLNLVSPANVQVVTRTTPVVTRMTLGGHHNDIGWSPHDHEQDKVEQDKEITPLPPTGGSSPVRLRRENGNGTEASLPYQMVETVCRVVGVQMSDYPKSDLPRHFREAKKLVDDGVALDEVEQCTRWLYSQDWWRDHGIQIQNIKTNIGKWRAQGRPTQAKRPTNGHVNQAEINRYEKGARKWVG